MQQDARPDEKKQYFGSESVLDCAQKVLLDQSIIDRAKMIERGLTLEGRKIQASLTLEEDVLKPMLRGLIE